MKNIVAITLALISTLNTFAVTNEEAIASFEIHPDFTIQLVAAEPQILDPVDLEFDERGRMFVIEMPGYPFPSTNGSVVLLEDKDQDGTYESRTVFATGFEVATSVLPYEGGLLVASPPDILFLKDTNGDNKADSLQIVLSGFEADNQQHNINGLTLGLDNWIYLANGGNSGSPYWPDTPDDKLRMGFNDIRFKWSSKPGSGRKLERFARSNGGFGITHDNYGRWLSTHNTQHIMQTVFPGRFLENIPAPRGGTLAQISDHEENGLARIYPIGAQETRVNHPEQSGFFSGGCGITFYNGGAFNLPGFDNAAFVCDVVLNLVHVDLLKDNNKTTLTASRDADQPKKAFLASNDRAFRPVNMTVGPDGALYLLDMHRDVIEHPEWIPDEMEEKLDLEAGKTQGRIYKIFPTQNPSPLIKVQMNKATNPQLVDHLKHHNGWYRKTAQRLIIERAAIDIIGDLKKIIKDPRGNHSASAVHALWTLEELGELTRDTLADTFFSTNPAVEENALWIAEERLNSTPVLARRILADRSEADKGNRMIMALVAGTIDEKDQSLYDFLQWVAEKDASDPWSRIAITSAAGKNPLPLAKSLWNSSKITDASAKGQLLASLYRTIGKEKNLPDLAIALAAVNRDDLNSSIQLTALEGLVVGLKEGPIDANSIQENGRIMENLTRIMESDNLARRRIGWDVARTFKLKPGETQLQQLNKSTTLVIDAAQSLENRLAHLALLEFDTPEKRTPLLFTLLESKQPAQLQKVAIGQLSNISGQDIAQKLVQQWDTLGPAVRTQAGNILLYKRANHDTLVTALENGDLSLGELNLHLERRRTLLYSRVPGIKERAEKLFTDAGVVTRKEALDRMRPALKLTGDPAKGLITFTKVCAECHTIGDSGSNLAPNLTEIFRKSAETLMHDIIDPNAATNAEYIAYNIETNDGDFYSGIVVRDDAFGVTLRNAEGEQTVKRENISEMFSSGLSLMPEELDTDMQLQDMADLLAYLQQPK